MNYITNDKQNVYYEIQGDKNSGECVLFLNGLTQSTIAWGLITPYFIQRYKIILLDFIFQGQSDKKGPWRNFDQHAKDVKCVLDQENISSVSVVGLSYGSLVAQHFAVNYPGYVKKLVLLSTFAHKTPYYEAVEFSWWRALESGGYNLMLDIMLPSVLSENYFMHPIIPINAMKEARKENNQNSEAIFNLMQATKDRKDYRQDLKNIKAPTLIIQGEKDLLLPVHLAEEVHANIKNSKLIVVRSAGHTLNLEHFAEVAKYIVDFLDQVE